MSGEAQWVESYFAPPGPAITNASTGTQHNVPTTENRFQRNRIRFTGVAPTVTGLADGKTGRRMSLYAIGGPLILANENTGSLVGNRIVTGTGADLTIPQGAVANLEYDEESQRWRVSSAGGSPGGGNATNDGGKLEVGKTGTSHFRTIDVTTETTRTSGAQNADTLELRPMPPGQLNVRDFGATGDGVTDDSAAIQACINSIPSITGQGAPYVVYFPPGVYRIATTIDLVRRAVYKGSGSHRLAEAANATTKILADDGVTAFKAWHGNMGYTDSQHAMGAVLEDLAVVAAGHAGATAYGLHMCTPLRVHRCHFTGFTSHGIYIDGTFGFPDNWRIDWTRCSENGGDGVFVEGNDSNNGLALGLDCQWNKGYGIRDNSFLGCTWISCHSAENLLGGYNAETTSPAVSVFIACYGESDQPPTAFERTNINAIASTDGAGFTPASKFTGGYGATVRPSYVISTDALPLSSSGTNPPKARLRGSLTSGETLNLVVQITTAGQPGGKDRWGAATGTTAEYRWSNDGGGSWTGPIAMPEAWNLYASGLCEFAIGSTGLHFVFVQGDYALDNEWTAGAGTVGALQSFCQVGSASGTHSPFGWGHVLAELGYPGADAGYRLFWNASIGAWEFRWADSSYYVTQRWHGQSLPRPGHVSFLDGAWFGTAINGLNRITGASADNTVGDATWLTQAGVAESSIGWFSAGDIIVNRSNATPYPKAWRAKQSGGYGATPGGVDPAWAAGTGYNVGDSILANSTVYRAIVNGTTSGGADPTGGWSTTRGATITDGGVTWEVVGPHGPSIFEPVGIQSEVLGTYDATAGSATLTLIESSYERLKITGAPGAGFNLEMPSAQGASGWRRVIWNTSGQTVTVKGSAGDTGVAVPTATAYDVISDGTNCVRVQ